MLPRQEFMKSYAGFPCLINAFGLVDEGIILNKDGSIMMSFYYSGPDLDSALAEEVNVISLHINKVLSTLSSGWMIHVDAMRLPIEDYPEKNYFQDPITRLIDDERRKQYKTHYHHFETIYACSLTYKPDAQSYHSLKSWILTKKKQKHHSKDQHTLDSILSNFKKTCDDIISGFSLYHTVSVMDSSMILLYLHHTITGYTTPITIPTPPAYLNHILGAYDFIGGFYPQIDEQHIGVVAMIGFPHESFHGLLDSLNELPFSFRLSHRFIVMDKEEASKELKKLRTKLHNRQFDILSTVMEIMSPGSSSKYSNTEAIGKALDANHAVNASQETSIKYGYYTGVILCTNPDKSIVTEQCKTIRKHLENHGFQTRIETTNAIEAYLGSIPGHSYANIRRPLINTTNLSHFIPLTTMWSGLKYNPNPMFDHHSPALFYAATSGITPFRFHLHVSDVGHALVLGPTGSGKSTLLAFMVAQFLRYQNAQIFCFDKGMSQYPIGRACNAYHYELLGENETLAFCPLQHIEKDSEKLFATGWIEELLTLTGLPITPSLRQAIADSIRSLTASNHRTLTDFYLTIQNNDIKQALSPFIHITHGIMAKLLDAKKDGLVDHPYQIFEIEHLMHQEPRYVLPVLTYLFHRIETRLDGRPTLIVLDEAWLMLDNPIFSEKIREWLKVLRKANAAVVFATQSIADIAKSSIKEAIIESCPTVIYLPNPTATTPNSKEFYTSLGLNNKQITKIANARPKHDYYVTSPHGNRMIDLELGDIALAFLAATSKDDIKTIRQLSKEYSQEWPKRWLAMRGLDHAASLPFSISDAHHSREAA